MKHTSGPGGQPVMLSLFVFAVAALLFAFRYPGQAIGTAVTLALLLTEAAQLSRLGRKDADVRCVSHCPEGLEVVGNASPRGGQVELFAEEAGEQVRLRVWCPASSGSTAARWRWTVSPEPAPPSR